MWLSGIEVKDCLDVVADIFNQLSLRLLKFFRVLEASLGGAPAVWAYRGELC